LSLMTTRSAENEKNEALLIVGRELPQFNGHYDRLAATAALADIRLRRLVNRINGIEKKKQSYIDSAEEAAKQRRDLQDILGE